MSFKKGDHVESDAFSGVGTIVEDRGKLGGAQTFRVAMREPGAIAQTLSVPEPSLRPARADDPDRPS